MPGVAHSPLDQYLSDPSFPGLHVRPPRGWINDPSGLALVDGRYHVFFQHAPDETEHSNIHWGHASSADLLRWRDEPVALLPREGELDSHGCWTGTVVDDGGVPTAVYTAVTDDSGRSAVLLARGDRQLREWTQGHRPATSTPDDVGITDVRDPFVFVHEGRRYAIQGAGRRGGPPRVLLYDCEDLQNWRALGTLLSGEDPVAAEHAKADIWECPNLVQIDGRWVLVLSLWRWLDGHHELAGVTHLVGDLVRDGAALMFAPTAGGPVDDGPAFYAPQLLATGERTLMWAWSWEHGRTEEQARQAGWAGVLTFPREVGLVDGLLASRPAGELLALRREQLPWRDGEAISAGAFEVSGIGGLTLSLVGNGSERVVATAGFRSQQPWRVLVDGSLVEAFSGPVPRTTRAYPASGDTWRVAAGAPDDVVVHRLALPTDDDAPVS